MYSCSDLTGSPTTTYPPRKSSLHIIYTNEKITAHDEIRAIRDIHARIENLPPSFLPVSQTHSTGAERDGVRRGHGRGLAQLSSRVPVRLQGGRNRRVPVEHDHAVARPVRQHRLGVRSQDAAQAARP